MRDFPKDTGTAKLESIYKLCDDCTGSKDEIRVVITILDDDDDLFYIYIKDLINDKTFCEYGLEEKFIRFSEKYYNFKIETLTKIK